MTAVLGAVGRPTEQTGEEEYLDDIISTLEQEGIRALEQFQAKGQVADIDTAIEKLVHALELTPDGHPNKPGRLSNLGISHRTRFERLGEMADIDKAIGNFEQCATSIAGPPIVRFRAARKWITALRRKNPFVAFYAPDLRPQRTLIKLIPELVWLGAPIHQRFETIQDVVGSSIHEAVSAAIRAQELELAVEWMEQGRSILWGPASSAALAVGRTTERPPRPCSGVPRCTTND